MKSEPELTVAEIARLRRLLDAIGLESASDRLHLPPTTLANVASGGKTRSATRALVRLGLALAANLIPEENDGTLPHS